MKKRKAFIRGMCLILVALMLFSLIAVALSGCSKQEEPPPIEEPVTPELRYGDIFLQSGFKIRAILTPQDVSTLDPLTFEVYVDSKGNGNGLVGYKDGVYDVIIANDKVYITVGQNTVINLTTLTGHMVPSSLDLSGVSDMNALGFTIYNDAVVAFKANVGNVIYDVTFTGSDATFEPTTVAAGNTMELNDVISYILDYEATLHVSQEEQTPEVVKESYYNKADEGVTIHGVVYSIGDYCNPDTYFEGINPSSFVPEYAWNKDDKVEFLHTSYISSDGKTEFVTTEGYVQMIRTTAVFEFLGMKTGDNYKELATRLGLDLKKADVESYKPIREGLVATKGKSNTIELAYKDLTISLGFDKQKALNSILITNYIDFVEEG